MFFITGFTNIASDQNGWFNPDGRRTFGYFDSYKEAEEALACNYGDMNETIYDYALIEEIDPGIHSVCKNRWFFEYDSEKNGFFRREEPKELNHHINFAIG